MNLRKTVLAIFIIAIPALAVATLAGCPAAISAGCQVIDVANATCVQLQVPDGDGGTKTVLVSKDEAMRFAKEREAAHKAAADKAAEDNEK